MTNAEAFKKVFGFAPRVMNQNEKTDGCFIPISVCNDFNSCKECPFVGFWDKEGNYIEDIQEISLEEE